jgi:hypothetical protein
LHRHCFETLQHASRIIGGWIGFYNHQLPHQALGVVSPAKVYALAAQTVQIALGQRELYSQQWSRLIGDLLRLSGGRSARCRVEVHSLGVELASSDLTCGSVFRWAP